MQTIDREGARKGRRLDEGREEGRTKGRRSIKQDEEPSLRLQ